MRAIVLFLVFLNLAFFYWASEFDSTQLVLQAPNDVSGYKPIKLLTELEQEIELSSNELSVKAEQISLETATKENYLLVVSYIFTALLIN